MSEKRKNNLPPYDCNGFAVEVWIQPHNIKAWYAWDWNKWCKAGSRDIIEGEVLSWSWYPKNEYSYEKK